MNLEKLLMSQGLSYNVINSIRKIQPDARNIASSMEREQGGFTEETIKIILKNFIDLGPQSRKERRKPEAESSA